MSLNTLRERLMARAGQPTKPALLCITGAAGAGKTATVAAMRERIDRRVLPTLELTGLGVPSIEEMHAAWESPRGWQKAMTWHWVYTAKHVFRTQPLVVLEGSFDPQYAISACTAHRMRHAIVLLDADDEVRRDRLAACGQAERATDEMRELARYLREYTPQLGGAVIDASLPLETVLDAVCAQALPLLDPGDEAPRDPRARSRRIH